MNLADDAKKAQIVIESTQYAVSGTPTQTMYTGTYRQHGQKHIFTYDEFDTESGVKTHNTVETGGSTVQITRQGTINTQMGFDTQEIFHGTYRTPYGVLPLTIRTAYIAVEEQEDSLSIILEYTLALGGEMLSDYTVQMRVYTQ